MTAHRLLLLIAAASLVAMPGAASAAPVLGQAAPAFQARDADGKLRNLTEFRGRPVILEWTNNGCPYVKRNYANGAMQSAQRQAKSRAAAVWLTVASSPAGQQGHMTPAEAKAWQAQVKSAPTAVLLDPTGTVARAYAAKTTPHMFVIDGGGRIAYMGAIDDKPTADAAKAEGAKNYVLAALDDLRAGRKVAHPVTKAYGCAVKYS